MAEYAITGDIATLLGGNHNTGDPAALWVEASQPILIVDSEGRTGGRIRVPLNNDGTFTVSGLPETVSGVAPLYRLHVDSLSLRLAGKRKGMTTGWFPLTASRDLTWVVNNYVEVEAITPEVAANIAAAAALGATNDTATASYFANPASATRTEADNTYVSVTEAPLNARRYAVGGVVTAASIQAAIDAMPGDESLGGGTILIDGPVPNIATTLTIDKAGVKFLGLGGYTSYLSPAPGLTGPLIRYAAPGYVLRGVQLDSLNIDMLNVNQHAIEIQGAFDNCHLSDVWVRGIHKDKSGFRFIPAVGAVTEISQSIIADNCQAIRTSGSTGATAPLWFLDTVHEANLRLCKAIGGGSADSGTGFHVRNGHLIKFDTCAGSNTQNAWKVVSEGTDFSDRVVVDTPLFEATTNGVLVVGNATHAAYRVDLRAPRVMTPITTLYDATYAEGAFVDGDVHTVILRAGAKLNRCFIVVDSGFQDISGTGLNDCFGTPNNAQSYTQINHKVRIGGEGTGEADGGSALSVAVNTSGSGGVPGTMRAVSVGAADSGGTGFRLLRVPN